MQLRTSARAVTQWTKHAFVATTFAAIASLAACSGTSGDEAPAGGARGPGGGSDSGEAVGSGTGVTSPRPPGVPQYTCSAPPEGVDVGTFVEDQLPEIFVKDCDGRDVSLNQYCGANATWLYVVHAWCPFTKRVGKFAEAMHNSFSGKGLVSLHIVYQSVDRKPPTADDCKAWRDGNGLKNVITLYDPAGRTKGLNDSTYTSLSLFLDKDRIIGEKSHTDNRQALEQSINLSFPRK